MRTGRPIKYPELTKDKLHSLYWDNELTIPQISDKLDIPASSIEWYFFRLNIKRRTYKQARALSIKSGKIKGVQLNLKKEELYDLYWNQEMTMQEIADLVGGCSMMLVKRKMRGYGIPSRTTSQAHLIAWDKGHKGNGRWQDSRDGYVYILKHGHPRADGSGYVKEHTLVWEQVNNKPLPEGWVVHHLNGIKGDNRPENLLGMYHRDHNSQLQLETMRQRIRDLEEKLATVCGQTKLGY